MTKQGCYIFQTPNEEIYILPIETLAFHRLSFILGDRKESAFYYFYGLDYLKDEPELEKQLLNYFKHDINSYPILDIHPCLQGDNYDKIKRFPKLFERINKLKVYYDKRKIEDICRDKLDKIKSKF